MRKFHYALESKWAKSKEQIAKSKEQRAIEQRTVSYNFESAVRAGLCASRWRPLLATKTSGPAGSLGCSSRVRLWWECRSRTVVRHPPNPALFTVAGSLLRCERSNCKGLIVQGNTRCKSIPRSGLSRSASSIGLLLLGTQKNGKLHFGILHSAVRHNAMEWLILQYKM